MKWKNKDAKTVVLTFKTGMGVYASIASSDWLDDHLFASYFKSRLQVSCAEWRVQREVV